MTEADILRANYPVVPIKIPEFDSLYTAVEELEELYSGRLDALFINVFLRESIQELLNGISLFTQGYFDAGFYCLRAASEVMDEMLYLQTKGSKALKDWQKNKTIPFNNEVKKEISTLNSAFKEIKKLYPDQLESLKKDLKEAELVIHKIGPSSFASLSDQKSRENLSILFVRIFKEVIARNYLLFICADPLCFLLDDPDIDGRINMDLVSSGINLSFLEENWDKDLFKNLERLSFVQDVYQTIMPQELMNPFTYDVVRNQYFDMDHLKEIGSQRHLLSIDAQVLLSICESGIPFKMAFPSEAPIYDYFTSHSISKGDPDNPLFSFSIASSNTANYHNDLLDDYYLLSVEAETETLVLVRKQPFSNDEIEKINQIVVSYPNLAKTKNTL